MILCEVLMKNESFFKQRECVGRLMQIKFPPLKGSLDRSNNWIFIQLALVCQGAIKWI